MYAYGYSESDFGNQKVTLELTRDQLLKLGGECINCKYKYKTPIWQEIEKVLDDAFTKSIKREPTPDNIPVSLTRDDLELLATACMVLSRETDNPKYSHLHEKLELIILAYDSEGD